MLHVLLLLAVFPCQEVQQVRTSTWSSGSCSIEIVGVCRTETQGPVLAVDGTRLTGPSLARFQSMLLTDQLWKRPWHNRAERGFVSVCVAYRVIGWRDVYVADEIEQKLTMSDSAQEGPKHKGPALLESCIFQAPEGDTIQFPFDAPGGDWQNLATFTEAGGTTEEGVRVEIQKGHTTAVEWTEKSERKIPQDAYRGRITLPKRYDGWRFDLTSDDPPQKDAPSDLFLNMLLAHQESSAKGAEQIHVLIGGKLAQRKNGHRKFTLRGRPLTRVCFILPMPK